MCMAGFAAKNMNKSGVSRMAGGTVAGNLIQGKKPLGAKAADNAKDLGVAQAAKPTKKKINTGLNIASKY